MSSLEAVGIIKFHIDVEADTTYDTAAAVSSCGIGYGQSRSRWQSCAGASISAASIAASIATAAVAASVPTGSTAPAAAPITTSAVH